MHPHSPTEVLLPSREVTASAKSLPEVLCQDGKCVHMHETRQLGSRQRPVQQSCMCDLGLGVTRMSTKKIRCLKVFKGPEEPTLFSNSPTVDTRTQRTCAVPKDPREAHAEGPKSFPTHPCCPVNSSQSLRPSEDIVRQSSGGLGPSLWNSVTRHYLAEAILGLNICSII